MRRVAAFGLLVMRRFAALLLWGVWWLSYLSLSTLATSGGFFAPSNFQPSPSRRLAGATVQRDAVAGDGVICIERLVLR